MKKIELNRGKGKTYRCLKRALKLVKKGKNVVYITPYGMNHAHELSLDFRDKIDGKINYYFSAKSNKFGFPKGNFIKFVSWEYYYKHTSEEFYDHSLNIIFDDIHMLFVGTLDTVSVTKGF
jgi:hypothetical protein